MTTATQTRQVLKIERDDNPFNPREWDNLGTLIYSIHGRNTREWFREQGKPITNPHEYLRGEPVAVRVNVPASYVDRYAGDAFVYVTKDKLRAEYGETWRKYVQDGTVARVLAAEGKEWRLWADGHVYGFTLTTEEQCNAGEWHEVDQDSCWGFIAEDGESLAEQLREHLPESARALLDDAIANID